MSVLYDDTSCSTYTLKSRTALSCWLLPVVQMLEELRALALVRAGMSEVDLNARLEERLEARKAKDFARSDAIRDELAAVGILLMDGPEGQSWCPSAEGSLKGEEDATLLEKSKAVV